jgi:hypothetical protein
VTTLPPELSALIAAFAHSFRVRTVAGDPNFSGLRDGHALREAKFQSVTSVAMDESDPAAGPQLILCDSGSHRIRCLDLRSEQVTTIAGSRILKAGHKDGPALDALFVKPMGVAVAPSGVIFVAEKGRGSRTRAHCLSLDSARSF